MKRPTALVFVSSVLAVVPFFACEDTSSNNNASFDAGSFDSAFVPPDGSVTDAPPPLDAPADTTPSNTATVVVTKGGAPSAGVTVVFEDAAGNLVGTAITGADGKATNPVVAGSQITVALGAAGSRQLLTYLAVKPGDVLNVVERASRDVSITLAGSAPPSNGTVVVAGNLNCSTNTLGTSVLVSLTPDCITGPTFPVLATLDSDGTKYFSFKKGNAPSASGTTTVTGLSAWATGTTFALNVTNAPNIAQASVNAYLGQIASNQSAAQSPTSGFSLNGGAGSAFFSVAGGYADAYQGEVQYTSYQGSYQQVLSFSKRIAGGAGVTAQALDLAPGVLPTLLTLVTSNVGGARPTITWTASASLATTDSGVVTLPFLQPIDAGYDNVEWTFIVPPGTLSVTAPQLPAQLAAFQPGSTTILQPPSAAFFESDLIAGYDAVRQQAAASGLAKVPVGSFSNAITPALPANGTLRITAITYGG